MAPRAYTQRRRAESSAATRARILEAAAAEYRERGVPRATLRAIARRADVSRGTVLHHFGDADGLLAAVIDLAVASIEYPDERVLAGAQTLEDRARRFAVAMLRFYDRTGDWWRVLAGEGNQLPALPAIQAEEERFWGAVGQLQAAALGPLAQDRIVVAATMTLVAPHALGGLRTAGLTLDEAVELLAQLYVDVVRRARGRSR